MNTKRILGFVEMAGETLVVAGAAVWLPLRQVAVWLYAVGVVLFAVGRFVQTPFYQKYPVHDPRELTLRRLYHQQVFGMVALILSAVLMWTPAGFYAGMYVAPSSWLLLFVIFVAIEVYTVFRISSVDKG